PFYLIDCDYECSASIGGTLFWDNSKTINDILKDADIAMYAVKKSGKNEINIA
ncbi:MAG: diguanylate cyclase, partial [Epsilonproteobacteria bacterium]|nr:diguanylate cyclase [Campylobacterota bacterium]